MNEVVSFFRRRRSLKADVSASSTTASSTAASSSATSSSSSTTSIALGKSAAITGKLEVRLMGCQDLLEDVPGRSRRDSTHSAPNDLKSFVKGERRSLFPSPSWAQFLAFFIASFGPWVGPGPCSKFLLFCVLENDSSYPV